MRGSVYTVEAGEALGSAFVISSTADHALLVTNYHVIEEVWDVGGRGVRLRKDEQTLAGVITRVDPTTDVALVQVPTTLPSLERATEVPSAGDPVLVVGSGMGLEGTVASGVVSSVRTEEGVEYLQFSAPINVGNSGGPVVDRHGRVVGVSVAKLVGPGVEGISFAVPVGKLCISLQAC